jgi:hypothetical protein
MKKLDLENGVTQEEVDKPGDLVAIGFECVECGNRVRNVGEGRICKCGNIVWNEVLG